MPRPAGSKNIATFEFAKRFDDLCKKHIDPLVLMFKIASGKDKEVGDWGQDHRIEASKTLLNYRYPKLKAVEVFDDTDKQPLLIGWVDGSTEINKDSDTLQAAPASSKTSH